MKLHPENANLDEDFTYCKVIQVEMNNSLYRQIRAAERKHAAFQEKLSRWHQEAITGQRARVSAARNGRKKK